MREADPLVVAVVLTWNDTELAGRCIESLLGSDYQSLEVVVVDNGSATPCGEQLAERFPEIEALVLADNQGFTGGCNRGLEKALGKGADFVFLLNNDTVVDAAAVGHLIQALEERPDAGAASALLLYPGDDKRVQFFTGEVDRDCARHRHPEEGERLDARDWPTAETDFAPACALLFRASALRDVGLFDERLGTCWEDYDLCLRFSAARRPYLAVGAARVVHDHGATTGKASPYITYFFTRNRLICLLRHGRPLGIARCSPRILRSLWRQVRAYGFDNWPCHRAFARGVVDFALGARGERARGRSRSDRPDRSVRSTPARPDDRAGRPR